MPGRGKKVTPKELDHLFEREAISEDDYRDFWSAYWKAKTKRERAKVIIDYTGGALPTKSKSEAKQDAIRLAEDSGSKYTVRRRNKKGQFSKRGRTFQAVRSSVRVEEDFD